MSYSILPYSTPLRAVTVKVIDKSTGSGLPATLISWLDYFEYMGLRNKIVWTDPPFQSGILKIEKAGYKTEEIGLESPLAGEAVDVIVSLEPELVPPVQPPQTGSEWSWRVQGFGALQTSQVDVLEGLRRRIFVTGPTAVPVQHFTHDFEAFPFIGFRRNGVLETEFTINNISQMNVRVDTGQLVDLVGMSSSIHAGPPPAPRTPQKIAWDNFFQDPNIVTVLGTVIPAVQNSFSLVFSGWDVIEDRPGTPEVGHYVSVGLIIAGVGILAAATIYAAIPVIAGITATATTDKAAESLGSCFLNQYWAPATKAVTEKAAIQYIVTGEGVISTTVQGIPGKAILLFEMMKAMPLHFKLAAALSGGFLLTQLDATGWFFGLSPEASHRKAETLLKSVRADMIRLEELVDNKDWVHAKELSDTIKEQLSQISVLMSALPKEFWEKFGFSFEDKESMLAGINTNFKSYLDQYPQLTSIVPVFPEEITVHNVEVEDGDTVIYPGHPEVMNRIRFIGIDAHESGTPAGIEEMAYLMTLIEGKTVVFKVDPHPDNQIGFYGRLLAVPFVDGANVSLLMLEKFGKDILTATKYQDKHKYMDWDEAKRVAAGTQVPGEDPFSINIDSSPTSGKLYIDDVYTHHLTPSDESELSDVKDMLAPGTHLITVTKSGKEGSKIVDILPGANPDIFLILKAPGLVPPVVPPVEPPVTPPVEPPVTEPFSLNITSIPSNAKLYIDDVYTHHLTPSNSRELSDVMNLLLPGPHVFEVAKSGKSAKVTREILPGANPDINLTLELPGLPPAEAPAESTLETRLKALEAQIALILKKLE